MVAFIVIPVALLVITEAWRLLDARRGREAVAAPIPAIRRVSDDDSDDSDDADGAATAAPAPRAAANAASDPAYAVKTLDLGLTFVVLVALAAYSAWMLYNEIRVESAMVLTGSVMALLLVVATWVLAMRAARAADTRGVRDGPTGTTPVRPPREQRPGRRGPTGPRPGDGGKR
jgi:hypothetical protein